MHRLLIAALLACLLGLAACSQKSPEPGAGPRPLGATPIAIAPFTHPEIEAELLAGALDEEPGDIKPKVLNRLTAVLVSELPEPRTRYVGPDVVDGCRDIVLEKGFEISRQGAFKHWVAVAGCTGERYLVVPQLLAYHERVGSDYGAAEPARVVLELYMIDALNERLVRRYRFDETQQALSDNLLNYSRAAQRGFRWLSAEEMAREAIRRGLEELGL
jgi:hypothetical protein